MLDSDVDSWYEWKREDDFNETHSAMSTNDMQLIGSRSLSHLQSDDYRKEASTRNGLICYDATSTGSGFNPEVRFINPAIYAETLDNEEDEQQEVEIRVKVRSKEDGRIGNHGDFTQMTDMMTTLSVNNDLTTSIVDQAGDQGSAQETYRCYSLNSPTTFSSYKSDVMRSKSVISCRPSDRVERRCKIVDMAIDNDQLCSVRQINSEVQRYIVI